MRRLCASALLIGCLAFITGCPADDDPGVETGQFGVTVTFSNEFGGTLDCTTIEMVVVSSAGDVFRDPGECVGLTWVTDLLPLEDYIAQINVYDANGDLSAQSDVQDNFLDLDGELVELVFDIVEDAGYFGLSWTLTGELSGDLDCEDVGAFDLVIEATYIDDGGAWDSAFFCTDYEAVGDPAPLGDYTVILRLYDDTSPTPAELNASPQRTVSLDYGNHLNDLGNVDFYFLGL